MVAFVRVVVLVLVVPAAYGQAFESVRLGASVARGVVETDLERYWRGGSVAELSAAVPFHAGAWQVGAARAPFEARSDAAPGFTAYVLYLGWGPVVELPGPLALRGLVAAGDFYMRFHEEERAHFGSESELAFGLGATLEASLGRRWGVEAGARWTHVFTREPIDTAWATLGLHYTLPTPPLLKRLLQ